MSYDDEGPHKGPEDLVRLRPPATISASAAVLDLLAAVENILGRPSWLEMWTLSAQLPASGLFHWQEPNLTTTVQIETSHDHLTMIIRSIPETGTPRIEANTKLIQDDLYGVSTITATLAPADISSLLAFLLHGTRAASVNIRTNEADDDTRILNP